MGGGLEKYSIQRGLLKNFFILERGPGIFCFLQSLKTPRGRTQP